MSVVNDPRTSRTAVGMPQVPVDTGGPASNDPDEALGMKSSYLVYEHNFVGTGLDVEVQGGVQGHLVEIAFRKFLCLTSYLAMIIYVDVSRYVHGKSNREQLGT